MRSIISNLGAMGISLGLISALAMMLGGYGTRLGWWPFGTGFTFLSWGTVGALTAALICLWDFVAGVIRRNPSGMILGGAGLAIGLMAAWVPLSWLQTARSVPPIHDITTDTENPPRFATILPLRAGAANSTEYGGPDLAAQQRAGYPDIVPRRLPDAPGEAFQKALNAARSLHWKIVDADAKAMRIEATDTTPWFGFKDDIVVRVTPDGGGARIDVRSVSRVGRSDVGTNAERIRKFLGRL